MPEKLVKIIEALETSSACILENIIGHKKNLGSIMSGRRAQMVSLTSVHW